MERLNESELEAVLAHELTHVKNRDMMVMTIATFLSSVAQILVHGCRSSAWAETIARATPAVPP